MAQVVGNPHHGKQGGARSLGFGILSIFVSVGLEVMVHKECDKQQLFNSLGPGI